MNEAWTKNGSSPFCSSHSITDSAHETRLGEFHREDGPAPRSNRAHQLREPLYRLVQIVGVRRDVETLRSEPPSPGWTPLLPGIFDQGAKSRQDPLVAEQPRVARRDRARIDRGVGVPEEHRVITRRSGQQRHVGEPGVQRGPVEDGTIAVLVRARVEAGPRRSARSGIGPVIREEDAAARQGVERGRLDDRMTEGGQAVAAPLVERDEEDVAWWRHSTLLPMARVPEPGRPGGRRCDRPGRAQEVRIVAPPSFVPNSINQAPRRGATARCTARPPGTGSPVAERCTAAVSLPPPCRDRPAAVRPKPSDPADGRLPATALPCSGSSVHLACLVVGATSQISPNETQV